MLAPNFSAAWESLAPFPLPQFAENLLRRCLAFDKLSELYTSFEAGRPLPDQVLEALEIRYDVSSRDLSAIPRTGATVVVANHPYGALEGALLSSVLRQIRPDVRILANGVLSLIPEMRDQLVTVDPMGGNDATRTNPAGLRKALQFLESGGLLVIFPAGEVSHYQWRRGVVEDSEWKPSIARMLGVLHRRQVEVKVVPAFISGHNSVLFHSAGLLHPRLRTAMLARELWNKRHCRVSLRFGRAVTGEKLASLASDEERIAYLRWRTYLLAGRGEHANTDMPRHEAVADPVATEALRSDLAPLAPLASSGALRVYLASAHEIPNVLSEIARLREITFRAVGEGTGRREDRDKYDETYLHLFVWNEEKGEVAGAYRLAGTDTTPDLYTQTLFRYGPELLGRLGPALELGRSFVRAEYQRSYNALLLLWKGIGEFIGRNPRYRVLFGPVSISGQYQAASRELMVAFLEKRAWWGELAPLVTSRSPLRRGALREPPPSAVRDFEELSELVDELEPKAQGVPVLLRQYLKLGGRLLGFNVDRDFAHALDGLIVVDLLATEPHLLDRYLGKEAAARFRAYQKGQHGTHTGVSHC
ncbi:MAG: lysophospholipid acyltransferase family protein [Bryobacterales bacterium]|nr:lysophospholipid acyltransferase family protein [Bryobacterales bacterium]